MRGVVNVSLSTTGRFPNPGPLALVRAGITVIDAPGATLFDDVADGESIRLVGSQVWSNGTMLAEGRVLDEVTLARALAEQQARVGEALEAFAANTLRHLHDEASALVSGISFPSIETRFRDRHALVIARGPGYKSDLRIVLAYIRDFRPVLVAVDGGADALLEAGTAPT